MQCWWTKGGVPLAIIYEKRDTSASLHQSRKKERKNRSRIHIVLSHHNILIPTPEFVAMHACHHLEIGKSSFTKSIAAGLFNLPPSSTRRPGRISQTPTSFQATNSPAQSSWPVHYEINSSLESKSDYNEEETSPLLLSACKTMKIQEDTQKDKELKKLLHSLPALWSSSEEDLTTADFQQCI